STWPGLAINVVLFMISPIYSSIFVYGDGCSFPSKSIWKVPGPFKWGKQYRLLSYQISPLKVNRYEKYFSVTSQSN
ncbi:TPA: hypothetical protein ACJ1QV_001142, partial [Streptococcus pneumoniae]